MIERRDRGAGREHVRQFTELRPLLFTLAYEILGSAAEAEDVLQDSYLRWAKVDVVSIEDSKAYLAKVVTRQSLNALRARVRRREEYVGPWLPEPILMAAEDPTLDIELAESVSTAMLLVLETLSPDERVVFVLREVFGFEYAEIATIVNKTAVAVRQSVHRAREHVRARRRRFVPVDAHRAETVTTEFLMAAATGDLEGLMSMLAPNVVYVADANGKATAARRPIRGAAAVAALMIGVTRIGTRDDYRVVPAVFNGSPGVAFYSGHKLEGVFVTELSGGVIGHIYAMRNPEKLGGVETIHRIGR
ncbi:RNA polymerase sigma-70 factor (ECF subfamily) [Rhodococcus sp. 27YEA15]|uniref:RNA polymerase sigma-70 factor n=1 Tax=Rhodococcus sp. 27YEA15 TaxID=3156259 RepID=UPI003C7B8D08